MEKKIIELKNISKNFEDQQVLKGIDLNIYENEFLTLLGPSGCGKTTLLRIIGGFEEPSNGQLIFDGKDISKVPPYKREVNTVFQKYALFPFLNVADNIAFGLNLKKMDKDVIEKKVSRMLELVDMQTELKKIQKEVGITFIFVTHDQEEALSMSDTIVVLNDGVIQQIGTPMDIYNEPQNRFVAEFIGESNIIEGNMIKDCLVNFDGIDWECVDKGFKDNEDIEVVLRPEDMDVVEPEAGKVSGTIISKVFMGLTIDPFDIQVMHKMEN